MTVKAGTPFYAFQGVIDLWKCVVGTKGLIIGDIIIYALQ